MKTLKTISILFISLLLISCGNKTDKDYTTDEKEDSKEAAKEQNDERFDDTAIEDDTKFAVEAADGGMLEVQVANAALSNASSSQVKEFAQTMINEHGKANDELTTLAANKGIVLPTTLSDKSQKKLDDLTKKTGADFDKAFCDFMVKDHKDDIDHFKKQAEKGTDPDLKAWAANKIPTLEHHLSMAEALDKTVADRN